MYYRVSEIDVDIDVLSIYALCHIIFTIYLIEAAKKERKKRRRENVRTVLKLMRVRVCCKTKFYTQKENKK